MIACKCPMCARLFNAEEARRGDVIACPNCGRQLRLPAAVPNPPPMPAPAPAEPSRARGPATAPQVQQATHLPDLDIGGPQPAAVPEDGSSPVFKLMDGTGEAPLVEPVPARNRDDGDEDEPLPERGPRRRRRRRRRKSGQLSRSELGLTVYLGGLGAAAFVALVLAVLSLLLPHLVLLVIVYGAVLLLTGMVWLYLLAHEDGWELVSRPDFSGPRIGLGLFFGLWTMVSLLVLVVTAGLYLASNPERGWKAGAVAVLGALTLAAGLFLLYHVPGA